MPILSYLLMYRIYQPLRQIIGLSTERVNLLRKGREYTMHGPKIHSRHSEFDY